MAFTICVDCSAIPLRHGPRTGRAKRSPGKYGPRTALGRGRLHLVRTLVTLGPVRPRAQVLRSLPEENLNRKLMTDHEKRQSPRRGVGERKRQRGEAVGLTFWDGFVFLLLDQAQVR